MPSPEQDLEAQLESIAQWRPSPSESALAQAWIDYLDQRLPAFGENRELYALGIRRLRKLCKKASLLPASCRLPNTIAVNHVPVSSSAFSDVYYGEHEGIPVAVKSLRVHVDDRQKVLKAYHEEAMAWKLMHHTNIAPFLGVSDAFPVCLVGEWMSNGTVTAYLSSNPTADRRLLIVDIVEGLSYMHSLNIVPGDIKPSNILIDQDGIARLSDFGISSILHATGTIAATSSTQGTVRWMAPELFFEDEEDPDKSKPSQASDVYAAGIVFWQFFSSELPFKDIKREHTVITRILDGLRPLRPANSEHLGLSDDLWQLMERAWLAEPAARPSPGEFLSAVSSPRHPDHAASDTSA